MYRLPQIHWVTTMKGFCLMETDNGRIYRKDFYLPALCTPEYAAHTMAKIWKEIALNAEKAEREEPKCCCHCCCRGRHADTGPA